MVNRSYYIMLTISLVYLLFFIIFCLPVIARDLSFGGQIEASLMAYWNTDFGFGYLPQADLDLELFLPTGNTYEIKCEGHFFTDVEKSKLSFFWKKLYWKKNFEKFNLSIGRQPISWSFGSLLNPVDYTLGAVALDRESGSKYQNAMEVYFPINWNTSLSLIASIPNDSNDLKLALRGRTLVNHFDVTAHVIQEAFTATKERQLRCGLTAKGDLGPFGIYSALGFYQKHDFSLSFLAGLDYSYFLQSGQQLYFQIEYMNIPPEIFSQITSSLFTQRIDEEEENMHLLANHSYYQIDEFSRISITCLSLLRQGSGSIISQYSNQFDANTTFRIQAGMIIDLRQNPNRYTLKSILEIPSSFFVDLGIRYSF